MGCYCCPGLTIFVQKSDPLARLRSFAPWDPLAGLWRDLGGLLVTVICILHYLFNIVADNGMNIARLNFSHGDHEGHSATLDRLREALASRPGVHVAVMLDTKGPEIRTGFLDASCGGKLALKKGDLIEIGTDYDRLGNSSYLACSYKSLATTVEVGSKILVADGSVTLEVTEVRSESVMALILNSATIGERKNMNLPGAIVDLPTLTEKDIDDIQNFGIPEGVDFIAASFVRRGSDIDRIREVLGEEGAHIKIIAKIENQEGLQNYDEILQKVRVTQCVHHICPLLPPLTTPSLTDGWHYGCPRRPGHGDPHPEGVPGSEDDDHEGQRPGQARGDSHADAGEHDLGPPTHPCGVRRRGECRAGWIRCGDVVRRDG